MTTMTEPLPSAPPSSSPPLPPSAPPPPPVDPGVIAVTHGEFLWLTFGLWLGGVFMLALLPMILIPRLGMLAGVGMSYLVFFLCWQPVQLITQRSLGMRTAVVRMVLFVGAAAVLAFYLREGLLAFMGR